MIGIVGLWMIWYNGTGKSVICFTRLSAERGTLFKKLIYIEVDGPFHFLIDGSSETRTCPAGSTILKHRQVRSLDEEEEDGTYTSALVSIPYWHWYAMNDIGKKQQYLCSLLGLSFDIK